LRVAALLVFAAVCVIVEALSAAAVAPNAPAEVGSPSDTRAEATLDSLRAEVTELRKKVQKPPKDVWDKVTALSGLASGLAVALIGFYATNVYNRRQRLSEERRKDQELLISQIQTVEKFIPYLSSKEENVKSGALIAISALGNEELAVKLATAFGGPAATVALTSIASTAGPQGVASAGRALQDIFQYLQTRVVVLTHNDRKIGGGFVISEHGWIVTPFYVSDRAAGGDLTIQMYDGNRVRAEVIKRNENIGLSLLATAASETLASVDLTSSEAGVGERIIALLQDQYGRHVEIGSIVGTGVGTTTGQIIVSLNNVSAENAGSPVVDSEGKLVGLIYAIDTRSAGTVYLVTASTLTSFAVNP
jgi:S1-C subfamily serine protease